MQANARRADPRPLSGTGGHLSMSLVLEAFKNDDIRLGMVSPLLWLPPVVQEALVPNGV